MRKLFLIAIILAICYWWHPLTAFVSGNFSSGVDGVTTWLVNHTPKK